MRSAARIRETWDAAAETGSDLYVGLPDVASVQLDDLFEDLGARARGEGTCLEIGCGAGRMTTELAERWPQVVAVDVSPAMLDRACAAVAAAALANVTLALVAGDALDGVATAAIDTAICFGVMQHLPSRRVVRRLFDDLGRVLRPGAEAFVQLPVLARGPRALAWRAARAIRLSTRPRLRASHGIRLTAREVARAVDTAGLDVVARVDHGVDPTLRSRYPHVADVRLRLRRRA